MNVLKSSLSGEGKSRKSFWTLEIYSVFFFLSFFTFFNCLIFILAGALIAYYATWVMSRQKAAQ